MATDREIGDLVARLRIIVEQDGLKDATLTLNRLEKRATDRMGSAGKNAGAAFGGGFSGALVGQGITTGLVLLERALTASIGAFLKAGEAGTLDPKAQESYIELDNALTEATAAAQEMALAIGTELAPSLKELVELFSDLAPAAGFLTDVVLTLSGVRAVTDGIEALSDEADESAGAAKRNAKAAKDMAEAHKPIAKIISEQEKAFRALVDAQIDELEAGLKVESAALGRADAEANLVEAQKAVGVASVRAAEFARDEADALEAVRDAQDRVADARFRAMRAADDLGEAQNALVEAEFRFGPQSYEAGEAADSLQEAQQELTEANREVTESGEDVASRQRDYQDALKAGQPTVEAAAEAQRDLAKAKLGVKQALLDQAAANTAHMQATAAAAGVTLTAAQNAKLQEDNLRSLAGYAGSPEFAAMMLAGANAISGVRAGSSLAGTSDGGRAFQGAVDQAVAGTTITIGPIYANDPADAAAVINREIDWATRGGGGGAVGHI